MEHWRKRSLSTASAVTDLDSDCKSSEESSPPWGSDLLLLLPVIIAWPIKNSVVGSIASFSLSPLLSYPLFDFDSPSWICHHPAPLRILSSLSLLSVSSTIHQQNLQSRYTLCNFPFSLCYVIVHFVPLELWLNRTPNFDIRLVSNYKEWFCGEAKGKHICFFGLLNWILIWFGLDFTHWLFAIFILISMNYDFSNLLD